MEATEYSGVEAFELFDDVEKSIGVEFLGDPAVEIVTPQDLIDVLSERLRASNGDNGIVNTAFIQLRKAIVAVVGVCPDEILPETRWDALLLTGYVARYWQAIARRVGFPLPSLRTRPGFGWIEFGFAVACLVAPGWLMVETTAHAGVGFAVLAVVSLLSALTMAALRINRVSVGVPPEYSTVGDTVFYLAAHNAKKFKRDDDWTRAEVEFVVMALTREMYSGGH